MGEVLVLRYLLLLAIDHHGLQGIGVGVVRLDLFGAARVLLRLHVISISLVSSRERVRHVGPVDVCAGS